MVFIVILLLMVGIALVVTLVGLTVRWLMERVVKQTEDSLRAANQIVNQGRVPETWAHSFSHRIDRTGHLGETDDDIESAGRCVHKHCLRQLDSLIRFLSKRNFFDSPETRAALLESLQEKREEWAAGDWRALMKSGGDS